jgi:hypothetical protein
LNAWTLTCIAAVGASLALVPGALHAAARAGSPVVGLEIRNESSKPWTLTTVEAAGSPDPRDLEGHVDYRLTVREFGTDEGFETMATAPSPGPGCWTLEPVEQKRELDPTFLHYRITPTALKAGDGGIFYFYLGGGNGIRRLFKVTCTYTGPKDLPDPYKIRFEADPQGLAPDGTVRGIDDPTQDAVVVVDESRRRLTIKQDAYPGRSR